MNEKNINDTLRDVIRMACHADLSSYSQIKRQALYDIYDAIASVLPVDHKKAKVEGEGVACCSATAEHGKEVVYKTPQHILDFIYELCNVQFADMADPALLKKLSDTHHLEPNKSDDEMTGMKKYLHVSDHLQLFRFRGSEFTKFIGRTAAHDGQPPHCYEIKVFRYKTNGGQASVYVDDDIIFSIVSQSSSHMIEKMAVSALKRWCKEHRRRGEMRKKKRNVPTVG